MKKLLSLLNKQSITEKFSVEFLADTVIFLENLDEKARAKIIYNITKAQRTDDSILLKKLIGEIWEFRTLFNRTYYTIFAFWDKADKNNPLIIASHGIAKKTGKIPAGELQKANRLRTTYFESR